MDQFIYMVNYVTPDDLAVLGARASSAMVLA